MKAPSFPYRIGGIAAGVALVVALTPVPQAMATVFTVGAGDATFTANDAGETNDVFMDSWVVDDGTTPDDAFSGVDNRGQGFWVRSEGDRQETDQNSLNTSDPLQPGGPGRLRASYIVPTPTSAAFIDATYELSEAGGVSTIVETFLFNIDSFLDPTNLSFFIWANPDLGASALNDTGTLSDADANHVTGSLYTQTDGDHPGRSYTMKSEVSAITGVDITDAPCAVANCGGSVAVKSTVTSAITLLTSLRDTGLTELGSSTSNSNDPEVGFQYDLSFLGANGDPFLPIQQFFTITMTKTFTSPAAAPVAAPEPASIALLAAGGVLLLGVARRRRG